MVEAALHISAVARGTHAGSVGTENRAVGGTHAIGRRQTAGFDQLRRTGVEVRFLGAVAAKHVVVFLGAFLIEREPERAVQRAAISAVQIALLCAQTRVCVLRLVLFFNLYAAFFQFATHTRLIGGRSAEIVEYSAL